LINCPERLNNEIDSLLNIAKNKATLYLRIKRELIELFILNFDFFSAALNLKYLTENEISQLKFEKKILDKLRLLLEKNDEKITIGLRLAYKLKLNRVYSVGDNSDKRYLNKISDKLYNEMILSDVYQNHRTEILNQTADNKLKEGISKQRFFRLEGVSTAL